MKALGFAIVAICALSIGACIWVIYFDSALREPAVSARQARASDTHDPTSASKESLPSAALPAPAVASEASSSPRTTQPAAYAPTSAPQQIIYDAFADNPTAPVVVAPVTPSVAAPVQAGPASETDKDYQIRAAIEGEFRSDPQAFARDHGLTPAQVDELGAAFAQRRKGAQSP